MLSLVPDDSDSQDAWHPWRGKVKLTDTRTPTQRRAIMQAVRAKDTAPEWIVRRLLHRLGYRYRLHRRDLPGRPDLVFPSRHKAIFVHGCFWHNHGCAIGRLPKSHLSYWLPKLEGNKLRDARQRVQLEALGWSVFIVWQCETRDSRRLEAAVREFLDDPQKTDRLSGQNALATMCVYQNRARGNRAPDRN